MKGVIALVGVLASSPAHAVDLQICVIPTGATSWEVTAEFLNTPPGDIVQIWADTSFRLTSFGGAPITITSYNQAYDTTLGPARITGNGTSVVEFVGNANSFFGTPDPGNPLLVATFESDFFADIELVGQNSALFDDGSPFGSVLLYQDAQGNPGELTFSTFWFPSPGTTALAPLAFIATRRRRK